jgi:hypothetical protein
MARPPFNLALAFLISSGCMVGEPTPPPDHDGHIHEPQPTTPVAASIAGGELLPIAPYTGITGRALMVRGLDGKTDLSIAITGLTAATAYTAHLHAAPCQYKGGGHYKIDPLVADTQEANELWIKGTSSDKGALATAATFAHLTRGEALSIVVHDPMGGGKMACADLVEDGTAAIELSGSVAPFAAAAAGDMTVGGTITATRTATGTSFKLSLAGLDPAAVGYGTHIHAEPCEVATGGGHYKLDPTIVDTLETNEIWLPVTTYTMGSMSAMIDIPHAARSDAQSIVVHRTITDANKPKIACANLTRRTEHVALETSGAPTALPAASGLAIGGTAMLTRKLTGVTELAIVVSGLAANTMYAAHVHNQACAADSGGGHFKLDPTVTEASADNEMWLHLTTDDNGSAHDTTWVAQVARADAASIVVHGDDGARLACFDLR